MTDMKMIALEQAREISDQALNISLVQPIKGWIYTVRSALGMTGPQLGARMGVKKGRISQIEQMEVEGRVTLQQLKKAANAMDCELIYVFRPRKPVDEIVYDQARKKSLSLVKEAQIHMNLEAQGLSEQKFKREVERLANEFVTKLPRDLWTED